MSASPLFLLLVRHGLTDWNEQGRLMGRSDVPLNAAGRAQIESLAEALGGSALASVTSSPQLRARQTAEILARAHDLSVRIDAGLEEVWIDRSWQGRTFGELAEDPDLARLLHDPLHVCDRIEPIARVQERMVGVVEPLRDRTGAGAHVLVSHGDPLRALIAHYLGLPLEHYRRMRVDNGTLSLLRVTKHRAQLLLLNAAVGPGALARVLTGS